MTSEWLKVMLEEIARKKAQAEQDDLELERRVAEHAAVAAAAPCESVAVSRDDAVPKGSAAPTSSAADPSA